MAFALFLGLMFVTRLPAQAPADTSGLYEMSLEQLLQLKAHGVSSETEVLINSLIASASNRPFTSRETPNVVTVITAEEIKRSGARDLIDILRLVPGIDFGFDVQGIVGIGIRGLWAAEGKVLLMIDGMEVNETMYGGITFGNDFPVEHILKIEVIRGSGSIVNGGFAEYAVISITTDNSSVGRVAELSTTVGHTKEGISHLGGGGQFYYQHNDFSATIRGSHYETMRSDRMYTDMYGSQYNMCGNSALLNQQVGVTLGLKKLKLIYTYGHYQATTCATYDSINQAAGIYTNDFLAHDIGLSYSTRLGKKWTLEPFMSYRNLRPWQTPVYDDVPEYKNRAERYRIRVTARWRIKRKISLAFGMENCNDYATALISEQPFNNGTDRYSYHNYSGFTEFSWKLRHVNVLAGLRYDYNSAFGQALLPRIALTKKLGMFNYKILYNESFKAPTIENVNGQNEEGISRELTRCMEIELGYQIGKKMMLTANIFRVTTRNPIVYYYDPVLNLDQYHNNPGSGSRGGELEFNYRDSLFSFRFCYSYYSARGMQKIESSIVPGQGNLLLAFPAHKLSFTGTVQLPYKIAVNLNGQLLGDRYGYANQDSLGVKTLTHYKPEFLVNTFISRDNIFPGFDLGIGCYNMLNTVYAFIQPYNDGLAPTPSLSREYAIRLRYTIPSKAKN